MSFPGRSYLATKSRSTSAESNRRGEEHGNTCSYFKIHKLVKDRQVQNAALFAEIGPQLRTSHIKSIGYRHCAVPQFRKNKNCSRVWHEMQNILYIAQYATQQCCPAGEDECRPQIIIRLRTKGPRTTDHLDRCRILRTNSSPVPCQTQLSDWCFGKSYTPSAEVSSERDCRAREWTPSTQ